ncbi:MAG: hypothetical protein JSR50_07320 [Proteobacteria bacterium]|nr:hypothetical protein [Pseudomonadota bacterium]
MEGASGIGFGLAVRIGTWAASKFPWKKFKESSFFPRSGYKARLRQKLIEMPFLFRDMQLSARDDYVALDVLSITSDGLRAQKDTFADHRGPIAKFEAYRKAFLFADGGYGKTTLFRNIALEVLARRPWQEFLGARGLLPIYVPLKVVQTAADFAIIEAIQASDPYFSGARGLSRIKRLGSKGKLIIFFDGYDEMPYTGGFDHVKRELETLFEKNSMSGALSFGYASVFAESVYWPIYKAIRESRIYLASRREFFEYNPIYGVPEVQTWYVRGLDDRRITLVEKIFSKYRGKTISSSGKKLNAELFLQQLSRASTEIGELSQSPLFLTVMCYIYVTEGASDNSPVFSSGASELVRICIRLLLQDLDEYKSRDFDEATRQAISNRRSAYPDEKLDFLRFFAKKLYEDDQSYFGEAYIIDVAREFFSKECQSGNCEEILRGLNSNDATINIIRQVILSGIFVLVEMRGESRYLDFPHRIFREVLAIDYFLRRPITSFAINTLLGKKYSELALLFVEQSGEAHVIVKELVERISSGAIDGHHVGLFEDVLARLPSKEAEAAVMDLLERLRRGGGFIVPDGAWQYLKRNAENCAYVSQGLSSCLRRRDTIETRMWLVAASRIGCRECEEIILNHTFEAVDQEIMSLVLEGGGISVQTGDRFILDYAEISAQAVSVEQTAKQLYKLFYVGRRDEDRQIFMHWANKHASHQTFAYARSVCDEVLKILKSEPEERNPPL